MFATQHIFFQTQPKSVSDRSAQNATNYTNDKAANGKCCTKYQTYKEVKIFIARFEKNLAFVVCSWTFGVHCGPSCLHSGRQVRQYAEPTTAGWITVPPLVLCSLCLLKSVLLKTYRLYRKAQTEATLLQTNCTHTAWIVFSMPAIRSMATATHGKLMGNQWSQSYSVSAIEVQQTSPCTHLALHCGKQEVWQTGRRCTAAWRYGILEFDSILCASNCSFFIFLFFCRNQCALLFMWAVANKAALSDTFSGGGSYYLRPDEQKLKLHSWKFFCDTSLLP